MASRPSTPSALDPVLSAGPWAECTTISRELPYIISFEMHAASEFKKIQKK